LCHWYFYHLWLCADDPFLRLRVMPLLAKWQSGGHRYGPYVAGICQGACVADSRWRADVHRSGDLLIRHALPGEG
jgi:hypothetical protein